MAITRFKSARAVLTSLLAFGMAGAALAADRDAPVAPPASKTSPVSAELQSVLDYAQSRHSTGFLIIRDGKVIAERNWSAPANDPLFKSFVYERASEGALLEDVASQQKSFVAVMIAIATDKGLIDVDRPVSAYLGKGWSRATAQQEEQIRVLDLLTMSSGLTEQFTFAAPAGTTFFYNTPVYAVTKQILVSVAGQSLDTLTRQWLTEPLGMTRSGWRDRPAALAGVGNATGFVTTPRDVAIFGQMILDGGLSATGQRIVSEPSLRALLAPSQTNPAYGRLWWLNGSAYTMRSTGKKSGPLIETAPTDLVAALGALDRRLYIVPSLKLIVVRTGAATADPAFDEQLWSRLMAVPSLR